MHGIPKGKRKFFNREKMIQQIVLSTVILGCFIYSFFFSDSRVLKVLSGIAVAGVGTMLAVYYVLEFMSGRGSGIAAAMNEMVYLVLGIPLMVIAAGYLPVSIYLSFFSRESSTQAVTIGLFVGVGVLEVLSISYLIVRHLRDKNMNLFQYLKYLFDFERRSDEVKRVKDRRDQIDSFYDGLHKVEQKIATKLEEKSTGFDQFDWKERVGQIGAKTIQSKKCWSCQATNDDDALFCENCQAPLEGKT
jgi:hypothetical protein